MREVCSTWATASFSGSSPTRPRLVPSRYLSVFWDERWLGIRLRRARGLMGREEGKKFPSSLPMRPRARLNLTPNLLSPPKTHKKRLVKKVHRLRVVTDTWHTFPFFMRLLITAWLWACDKSGKFTSRWNWDWLVCSLVSSGHIAGNGLLLLKHERLRSLWSEILSPNLTKNINRWF